MGRDEHASQQGGHQGSPRCGSGHEPEADPGCNTGTLGCGQCGGRPAPYTACESRGGHSGHRQAHCLGPPSEDQGGLRHCAECPGPELRLVQHYVCSRRGEVVPGIPRDCRRSESEVDLCCSLAVARGHRSERARCCKRCCTVSVCHFCLPLDVLVQSRLKPSLAIVCALCTCRCCTVWTSMSTQTNRIKIQVSSAGVGIMMRPSLGR